MNTQSNKGTFGLGQGSAFGLTKDDLRNIVPAAFVTEPADQVSSRYSMIRTEDIIDNLMDAGWVPVSGAGPRRGDKLHGTHRVNFRNTNLRSDINGILPELILYNNHAGRKCASIVAGFLRLVCSNGLVVSTGIAETRLSTVHRGEYAVPSLSKSIDQAIKSIEAAELQIQRWQAIEMDLFKALDFANRASQLRFHAPRDGRDLLQVRRNEDVGSDLWTVFNVVQENMINGKPRAWHSEAIRGIRSVVTDKRLNQELWSLAESFDT